MISENHFTNESSGYEIPRRNQTPVSNTKFVARTTENRDAETHNKADEIPSTERRTDYTAEFERPSRFVPLRSHSKARGLNNKPLELLSEREANSLVLRNDFPWEGNLMLYNNN